MANQRNSMYKYNSRKVNAGVKKVIEQRQVAGARIAEIKKKQKEK